MEKKRPVGIETPFFRCILLRMIVTGVALLVLTYPAAAVFRDYFHSVQLLGPVAKCVRHRSDYSVAVWKKQNVVENSGLKFYKSEDASWPATEFSACQHQVLLLQCGWLGLSHCGLSSVGDSKPRNVFYCWFHHVVFAWTKGMISKSDESCFMRKTISQLVNTKKVMNLPFW